MLSCFFRDPVLRAAVVAALYAFVAGNAFAFGFDDVAQRARQLAAKSYEKPPEAAKELRNLTYDQYRDIRFKEQRSLWRGSGSPFEIAFFHVGFHFQQRIKVNEVTADGAREIRFNADDFDYSENKLPAKAVQDAGFAGF